MDAFTWILILLLGACVLMHFFGHGHGHGHGRGHGPGHGKDEAHKHAGHADKREEEPRKGSERRARRHAAASGRGRSGGCCH
jgi:hypothetical protein